MINDGKYYEKIKLKSFPEIKNKLLDLHKDTLFPIKKQAVRLQWSRENFLDLYDEINEIAKEINSPVTIAKFFITPPYNNLGVHVDSTAINPKSWALNIPILSHEDNHYMFWYDYQGEYITVSDSYNNSIKPKNVNQLTVLDKLVLTDPHYVKIGVFHSIENRTPTPRIVLTLRFTKSFNR